MMTPHDVCVVFNDVSFAWPDGSPLLRHVTTAFGPGRTGLIGANGTMDISSDSQVSYLPQHIARHTDATVADLLGIRMTLDALRAIERGSIDEAHFDAVGQDWDVEARAEEVLQSAGVGRLDLHRHLWRWLHGVPANTGAAARGSSAVAARRTGSAADRATAAGGGTGQTRPAGSVCQE